MSFTPEELKELGKTIILNNTWTLFFHEKNNNKVYNNNTIKLIDINTIADFWGTYNNIPEPSKMFFDGINHKKVKSLNATPNALSFFKKDIYPAWEDPNNVNGFEFSIKYYYIQSINEFWKNTLITVINEDYESSDYLNGVRIVDCSVYNRVIYRLEFWFNDKKNKNIIENDIKNVFYLNNCKLLYRDHNTLKEK